MVGGPAAGGAWLQSESTGLYDTAGRPYRHQLPLALAEQIRQILEHEIVSGQLEPGRRITEEEIADRLKTSRTPIREALRIIEGQGLIVRRRGRGIYITETASLDEVEALYQVRQSLEGFLAGRAAERAGADERALLEELQAEFERTVDTDEPVDLRRFIRLDVDIHWTVYHAAGSDLVSLVSSYWGRLQRELYARVYVTEPPKRFADEHREIIDAINRGDAQSAQSAMEGHIASGWRAVRTSYVSEPPEQPPVPPG